MSIFPAALAKCHVIPFSLQSQKKNNPKHVTQVNGDPIIEETYRRGLVCFIRFFRRDYWSPNLRGKNLTGTQIRSFLWVLFLGFLPAHRTRKKKSTKKHGTCLLCCFDLEVLKLQGESNVPLPTKNECHPARPKIEIRPYLKGIPYITGEYLGWNMVMITGGDCQKVSK